VAHYRSERAANRHPAAPVVKPVASPASRPQPKAGSKPKPATKRAKPKH
jgi:hypothetical protein